MNAIFLDFDGVLHGGHDYLVDQKKQFYKRINILSEIVKEYDCKVVIEAGAKSSIDEETLETDNELMKEYLDIFKKYGIEVVGRTPNCEKRIAPFSVLPMWKEDEILQYLLEHPEIEHFCIIDDDDYLTTMHIKSDLEKFKDYLVAPVYFAKSGNPDDEGLLIEHKEQIGEILQKENKYSKYAKGKETIFLDFDEVRQAIVDYFSVDKDYKVSVREKVYLDFKGNPQVTFYLREYLNKKKSFEYELAEEDVIDALMNYIDYYGYKLDDFKYVGGAHRVGYYFDEDTPYYDGVELKVKQIDKITNIVRNRYDY